MPVIIAAVALLGLAVGSFLNVVIHRVPLGMSLVRPASACPSCDSAIRTRHNIPVLGWLLLRGRCADCAAPISVRYPVIEAVTAVLFVATTLDLARLGLIWALPAYLVFVAAGVALAAIDLSVMRLPNAIVYPTFVAVLAFLALAALVEHSWEGLLRAAIGAAALAFGYLALAVAKPGGMGLGDVKLAAVIGAVLGFLSYPALFVGTFAAFVLGAVLGSGYLLWQRLRDSSSTGTLVPFGPAMVTGALVAIFATAPLLDLYHSFSPTV